MELEIINDPSRLSSIVEDWRLLASSVVHSTPFQLPEWGLTWWRFFGSGRLHVYAAWSHQKLVGLLPCFLHPWNGRRQLTIIGSGVSDYLGCMVLPEYAQAFLTALEKELLSSEEWDVCKWQDLSQDDVLATWHSSDALSVTLREDVPCARRRLQSSGDAFLQSLSSGLRRNVRRYAARLEELGSVEFGVARRAQTRLIESIFDLHTREWNERGGPGMVEENGSGPFLRAVAEQFAKSDWFRLFYILFERRPVACVYAIVDGKVAYGYMSGFDPEYAQFSVGTLVLAHAMQCAIAEGLDVWDFLRGDELYKFNWGAEAVPKWRLAIERASAQIAAKA